MQHLNEKMEERKRPRKNTSQNVNRGFESKKSLTAWKSSKEEFKEVPLALARRTLVSFSSCVMKKYEDV